MPYKNKKDLPEDVKDALLEHAQEIYMEAFDSADKQYDSEKRAHKVAWSAVKKEYKKEDGEWVKEE